MRSVGPEAEPLQVSVHGALRAAKLGGDLVEPLALVAVAALVAAGRVREADRQRPQFPAPAERCCASVTEPGAGRGELTTALETGRPLLLPRRGLALQLAALGEQTGDGVAVTALPVL